MPFFALEHSKAAYVADFGLYGIAVTGLAAYLLVAAPVGEHALLFALVILGLIAWSPIEYGLHRFVLHGVKPFRDWHQQHHARPRALICMPTVFSAALIGSLIWLPAWWLAGRWQASALTLDVLAGYWLYALAHHATHHWRSRWRWLKRSKTWHALHHSATDQVGRYGVTGDFGDHQLGTAVMPGASTVRSPRYAHLVGMAVIIIASAWLMALHTPSWIAAWYLVAALVFGWSILALDGALKHRPKATIFRTKVKRHAPECRP
jgi:cyclopropane-fatty-acyl-phospholipid synthase